VKPVHALDLKKYTSGLAGIINFQVARSN